MFIFLNNQSFFFVVIINWSFDLSNILVSIILILCIIFKDDHNIMNIKVLLCRKLNLASSLFDYDGVVLKQYVGWGNML